MSDWVDFKQVKSQVTFAQVLSHYNLNLVAKGDELRGLCPFHDDHRPSLRVSLQKQVFHCFGCQAKGGVIDFVAAMEHVDFRDAALKLQEWFNITPPEAPVQPARTKSKGEVGREFDVDRQTVNRELDSSPAPAKVNPSLPFTLKGIDPSHSYLSQRGVSPGLAEFFGVGFFPGKGSMQGRIVIPIHDEAGELVAYAGRAIDDSEPRYRLPTNFQKSLVLFNLHRVSRVVTSRLRPLIIVEGFFDCIRVAEAGFPVVALMGNSLSEHQELLLKPFAELVLMLDNDEPGRKATSELLPRLARRHFVRVVDVPGQPDSCPVVELQALLAVVSSS